MPVAEPGRLGTILKPVPGAVTRIDVREPARACANALRAGRSPAAADDVSDEEVSSPPPLTSLGVNDPPTPTPPGLEVPPAETVPEFARGVPTIKPELKLCPAADDETEASGA